MKKQETVVSKEIYTKSGKYETEFTENVKDGEKREVRNRTYKRWLDKHYNDWKGRRKSLDVNLGIYFKIWVCKQKKSLLGELNKKFWGRLITLKVQENKRTCLHSDNKILWNRRYGWWIQWTKIKITKQDTHTYTILIV